MERLRTLPNPVGMDRQKLVDLLLQEEYGILPSDPHTVTATVEVENRKFCAGKAQLLTLSLHCSTEWGEFSFPVYYSRPTKQKQPLPCFLHINFRDLIPDLYQPTEELVDAGYATVTFCYKDVTSDDGDFTNGLAGVVYPNGKRESHQCGKIGLWAWAAKAVLKYLLTLPELDPQRISVVGHSRLGKTALLAGALDKRFHCAFSNDSGCSGAALSRKNEGETVQKIVQRFPYWFCEHYAKYADNEDALPFDQHYLLAANASHLVYVASAAEDLWADPKAEYLSCVAASDYFEANGTTGFVHPNRFPNVGEALQEGHIGYHLRAGIHYLGREDWQFFIRYLSSHNF